MKTIYMTGNQWQNRTLRGDPDCAAGGSGPRIRSRGLPAGGDKVVDLAAWRAENLTVPDEPEAGWVNASGQRGSREPVRRRHRRSAAQDRAELAATLAVTVALLALAARVLLF